jgi:hypothetical protein
MSHTRFETVCPGCLRVLHALTIEKRRARVLRHIQNCNAFKKFGQTMADSEARQ